MVNIAAPGAQLRRDFSTSSISNAEIKRTLNGTAPSTGSTISVAASAADQSTNGLDYKALKAKAESNLATINYPFEGEPKALAAKQKPEPNDAAAAKSADAASAYLNGMAANPFAGMSREQLATISNDESGTFTVNERRAAARQTHSEEEAWRIQVAAKATREYEETGKLTDFFKDALSHFMELPKQEQVLYPENYAEDLRGKIKLNFNYFTHSAGNSAPSAASLANLNKNRSATDVMALLKFPAST
jgi:hypothetical protein